MPYSENVAYVANIATIIALLIAIVALVVAIRVYNSWKKDFRLQHAHTYALDLLKKMKILHYAIEQLRAPKFYNPKKLAEDMRINYIPKIEEMIFSKAVEIQADLIMAKTRLSGNDDLQKLFDSTVGDKIIRKIRIDIHTFIYTVNDPGFDVKKCDLFATIFPAETIEHLERKIKKSKLGTNQEIIDDDFNQTIEKSFQSIYCILEDNLI